MRVLKDNLKLIIGFILGVILASSITVYAYSYFAKDIGYTKPGTESEISVETALNELYNKRNNTDHEIGCWIGYTNYISGSIIKKEDGTATKDLATPTPNIGNKIRIERTSNSSQVTCYAVQTGNFKIIMVNQNGDPTVYEQYVEAGNTILTASSITMGIIEALF